MPLAAGLSVIDMMKLAKHILTINVDARQFRVSSWQRADKVSEEISCLDKRLGKVKSQVEASLDCFAWFERNFNGKLNVSTWRIAQLEQKITQIRLTCGAPQTPNTKKLFSISKSVNSKSHCFFGRYLPILTTSCTDVNSVWLGLYQLDKLTVASNLDGSLIRPIRPPPRGQQFSNESTSTTYYECCNEYLG